MDFVRLYCMLEAMNIHRDSGRQWLRQLHAHLQERPIDALLRSDGLHRVLDYIQQTKRPQFDMVPASGDLHLTDDPGHDSREDTKATQFFPHLYRR